MSYRETNRKNNERSMVALIYHEKPSFSILSVHVFMEITILMEPDRQIRYHS